VLPPGTAEAEGRSVTWTITVPRKRLPLAMGCANSLLITIEILIGSRPLGEEIEVTTLARSWPNPTTAACQQWTSRESSTSQDRDILLSSSKTGRLDGHRI
jgi:hypothetical protein